MDGPSPDPLLVDPSDYVRDRLIRQESFRSIWLGHHKSSANVVCLKYVNLEAEEDRTSFGSEIEAMRQTVHPATLSCRGFKYPTDEAPEGLIVMDYMSNGSLGDLNRAHYDGRAPPRWDDTARSKAVLGIAAGMFFVHSLGLLHHNLRPANILVDDNFEIHITHFGRFRSEVEDMSYAPDTILTQAPEMFDDRDNLTNAADVFSYAVCLYLLFSDVKRLDDERDSRLPSPRQFACAS
jgi:serine/threonine protein kinase